MKALAAFTLFFDSAFILVLTLEDGKRGSKKELTGRKIMRKPAATFAKSMFQRSGDR